jgi:hypothetical protein
MRRLLLALALVACCESAQALNVVDIALQLCSRPQDCKACLDDTDCAEGTPRYKLGKSEPFASPNALFDCSALVEYSYQKVGFDFPPCPSCMRRSEAQSLVGQKISGNLIELMTTA